MDTFVLDHAPPEKPALSASAVLAQVRDQALFMIDRHGRADDNRWMLRRDGRRFFALGALTRLDDAQGMPVG